MAKRNKNLHPQTISPPETERDELTGRYTVTKREATQNWFRNARKVATDNIIETRTIDPKQVAYTRPQKKIKK